MFPSPLRLSEGALLDACVPSKQTCTYTHFSHMMYARLTSEERPLEAPLGYKASLSHRPFPGTAAGGHPDDNHKGTTTRGRRRSFVATHGQVQTERRRVDPYQKLQCSCTGAKVANLQQWGICPFILCVLSCCLYGKVGTGVCNCLIMPSAFSSRVVHSREWCRVSPLSLSSYNIVLVLLLLPAHFTAA